MTVAVGTMLPHFGSAGLSERRAVVAGLEAAGVDHLAVGDHVSFFGGQGFDGLVHAAHLLALSDRLAVHVGVYLLALRHPGPGGPPPADPSALAPGPRVAGA